MKIYQEFALITFLVFVALGQVQGKYNGGSSKFQGRDLREMQTFLKQKYEGDVKPKPALKYMQPQYPSSSMDDFKYLLTSKENIVTHSDNAKKTSVAEFSKTGRKIYSPFKAAKTSNENTNTRHKLHWNVSNQGGFRVQKIYCRQVKKIEFNSQGNSIENIHHICEAWPKAGDHRISAASSTSPSTHDGKDINERQFESSTPKGINCRRIMNSELNEAGEIVDSVMEVCDPAPTTSTTTKKSIWRTTPKITTTTLKPLVKVCRPVMNSYLNDKGQIIDSVTTVCKMERST